MPETARDVMDRQFDTLSPETTIVEAVRLFQEANATPGRRIFGMMVVDAAGQLLGMCSIYDILLLLRPKHMHIYGEMADLELTGLLDAACRRARGVLVGDIMTTDLITITPDTHTLMIVDLMIKKHVRRIPVLQDGRIVGIVYLSRVFEHLMNRLAD